MDRKLLTGTLEELVERAWNINDGKTGTDASDFQNHIYEIFSRLFEGSLNSYNKKQTSEKLKTDGIFFINFNTNNNDAIIKAEFIGKDGYKSRFDAQIEYPDSVVHPVFLEIKDMFRTLSIVIECKNYRNKVTQKQIYSTEKYLYPKALRSFCIMVCKRDYSASAKNAAISAFRNDGKFILLLNQNDIKNLLNARNNVEYDNRPEIYLWQKINEMLLEIGR